MEISMKTFKIYKISGMTNEFCSFIEAQNEKSALKKYCKSLLSSGQYQLMRIGNSYHLYSSYGAEWVTL